MTRPQVATIGADVEGFMYNVQKGAYVPCVGLIPGTKDHPCPVEGLPKGYATQEDNVMIEWNIPPATSAQKFSHHVKTMRTAANLKAKEHGCQVVYTDAVFFEDKDLTSQQAMTFGCDPDFDAYQGGEMRPAPHGLDKNMRGAGGHIHVGGDFQCPDFVAALFMDLVVGVSVGLAYGSSPRDAWYGKPGIYRPKTYGIEYRTPSCTWAESNETTQLLGARVLKLSKWLSETDAAKIQQAFTKINWREVYAWMTHQDQGNATRARARSALISHAKYNGVPL